MPTTRDDLAELVGVDMTPEEVDAMFNDLQDVLNEGRLDYDQVGSSSSRGSISISISSSSNSVGRSDDGGYYYLLVVAVAGSSCHDELPPPPPPPPPVRRFTKGIARPPSRSCQ